MSASKKSFYAIIPGTVRYSENICANAKLLYGEITALCNEQGFCWANNHYFSELYKVSKVSISNWISSLEKEGFIEIEIDQSKGNLRKIFIGKNVVPSQRKVNDPHKENFKTLVKKTLRPSQRKLEEGNKENFKHNNTFNNTFNNTINNTEREARALDFLKNNYPSRYESFEMQCKQRIKNFKKFCLDFNDIVDQEELKYSDKVLFSRLNRYARNWIENEKKYTAKEEPPRNYLKKIL